jgi:ABC-type spermidine/putrescine transport system permease subunit I
VSGSTPNGERSARLWPALAFPGTAWIVVLFVAPFYAIAAVAFGATDPLFGSPVPVWNPLHWQFDSLTSVIRSAVSGDLQPVFLRTVVYVVAALTLCIVIGYPVA